MKKTEESFLIFYVMLYLAIITFAVVVDFKIFFISIPWTYVLYKLNNYKSTNKEVK